MICRSDLRSCLGAMFNRLRANDDDMWMLIHDSRKENYLLYIVEDNDIPWPELEQGDARIVLCMSRLEIMVLLSEPVMAMFKDTPYADAAASLPPGE